MKKYSIKINADIFMQINANNKDDARNKMLEKLTEMEKIADIDVQELNIKNDKSL